MTFPAKTTPEFWDGYRALPREAKQSARKAFRLWKRAPFHPSIHFKKVGKGIWSARAGLNYRSLGRFEGGVFVWGWIGSHSAYDKILGR